MKFFKFMALCFFFLTVAQDGFGDEVKLKKTALPNGLKAAVDRHIADTYRQGCGTRDAFVDTIYNSESVLDRREYFYQLAGFDWYVSQASLSEADKRNGKAFRGTLVIAASAYRKYEEDQWTDWRDMTEADRFTIIKDKTSSWKIEPKLDSVKYVLPSCEEVGKRLEGKPRK